MSSGAAGRFRQAGSSKKGPAQARRTLGKRRLGKDRLLGLGLVLGLGFGCFGLLGLGRLALLLVALGLLGLGNGGTQDIAQAGSGVRRAEFLQRLLVLLDFAG